MQPTLPTADLSRRVQDVIGAIRARTKLAPVVGITLGSGLGGAVDALTEATTLATAELPHWPRSTVPGHAGRLGLGNWQGVPVIVLSGRSHRYEGYSLDQITLAPRVMHALGARTLFFTNAVGALTAGLEPEDVMLATDHINFIGKRGLLTPEELQARRGGRRVGSPHSAPLRETLILAAARAGIALQLGVLMGGMGPSYETAAEVRMARALGADAACMSTVHEVTVAAELGCEVASLSIVTNRATGLGDEILDHKDVERVAGRAAVKVRRLLEEWLGHLDADGDMSGPA